MSGILNRETWKRAYFSAAQTEGEIIFIRKDPWRNFFPKFWTTFWINECLMSWVFIYSSWKGKLEINPLNKNRLKSWDERCSCISCISLTQNVLSLPETIKNFWYLSLSKLYSPFKAQLSFWKNFSNFSSHNSSLPLRNSLNIFYILLLFYYFYILIVLLPYP